MGCFSSKPSTTSGSGGGGSGGGGATAAGAGGSAAASSSADPHTPRPSTVAVPSTSLFDELNVPLLRRPSVELLRLLWDTFDVDRNDVLSKESFIKFLKNASETWGDGAWMYDDGLVSASVDDAATSGRSKKVVDDKKKPSMSLLSKDEIDWPSVVLAFWGPPVFGVPSPTVVLIKRVFLQKSDGSNVLGASDASNLVKGLLCAVRCPKSERNRLVKSIATPLTLEQFVKHVGPTHAKHSDEKVGLTHAKAAGDLPVKVDSIESFAPERDDIDCQILNCGEATLTAMLYAIKGAKREIMMSWWEFCPTYPAIRNAKLGNDAWKDESGGTLPPILKQKAESGCQIYILLYDRVDIIMPTALVVEYAIKTLGNLHPNIHVVSHPGWNVWTETHHQKFVVVDRTVAILGGIDWTVGRWDRPDHPAFDFDSSFRPGLDMIGGYPRFQKSVSEWWINPDRDPKGEDRAETAIEPWQDVSVRVDGLAASDVAKNFMDRWEFVRKDVLELIGDGLRDGMPSIPKTIKSIAPMGKHQYEPSPEILQSLVAGGYPSSSSNMTSASLYSSTSSSSRCRCRIVRSLGDWSGGLKTPEMSHYQAWIHAVNNARRFIYVEQQYFTSNMGESDAKNRLAEAILNSVVKAIEDDRPFRVYVVVPEEMDVAPISYYTRRTLLQDSSSDPNDLCLSTRIGLALESKAKPGGRWVGAKAESVLSVCTASRVQKSKSGVWEYKPIFVHSKVLVVDDTIAVVGSANANDRSFLGTDDSELGAIIWSDGGGDDVGGGGPANPVKDFRLRLWRQYLGLSEDGADDGVVLDPSSSEAFDVWSKTASANQELISSVFDFTPRDEITSYGEYRRRKGRYRRLKPSERGAALTGDPNRLVGVKGQLTVYPSKFLSDQSKKSFLTDVAETFPFVREGVL